MYDIQLQNIHDKLYRKTHENHVVWCHYVLNSFKSLELVAYSINFSSSFFLNVLHCKYDLLSSLKVAEIVVPTILEDGLSLSDLSDSCNNGFYSDGELDITMYYVLYLVDLHI